MRSYTQRIFILLWLSALLSATLGVSVEKVYCYCTGKTQMGWFAEEMGKCQKQSSNASETQSCCAKKKASHGGACHKGSKQGCTKRTTYVFQLKTEYEVANPEFKKLDAPVLESLLPELPVPALCLPCVEKEVYAASDLPPPISGRMICVRHGVFRC